MIDLFNPLIILFALLALGFGLFLAFRQLVLWYFRLNQIADDIAIIANHYRTMRQPVARPTTLPGHALPGQVPPVSPSAAGKS